METNELPKDLIPATVAARLVPSPRGGHTHPSTIIRWILSGRIAGWRRGPWWFVSQAEVLEQLQPVAQRQPRPQPRPAAERRAQEKRERWTRETLARFGIK